MDTDLMTRITALETKVDAVATSVEKIRKYFLWTGIASLALFLLPLIGLIIVIPSFLSTFDQVQNLDSLTQPY